MHGFGPEGKREESIGGRLRGFWLQEVDLASVGMHDPENTWWNGSGYAGWARHAQPAVAHAALGEPPSTETPFRAVEPAVSGLRESEVADLVRALASEADWMADEIDATDFVRRDVYTSFLYETGAPPYCEDWGLGTPGAYRKVSDVYRRDFARGMALANMGSIPRSITLDEPHQTLDGKTVTSVTIAPHSAELLRRLPASSVHLPPGSAVAGQTKRQKAPQATPKTRGQR